MIAGWKARLFGAAFLVVLIGSGLGLFNSPIARAACPSPYVLKDGNANNQNAEFVNNANANCEPVVVLGDGGGTVANKQSVNGNLAAKIFIDQGTPGTTNGVRADINQTTPGSTNNVTISPLPASARHFPGCNVGATPTPTTCLVGSTAVNFLQIQNTQASNAVACTFPISSTVTITIASPGVVTWAGSAFVPGQGILFTTTGALPTGITAGTVYFVSSTSEPAGSFAISTTAANALAGTNINTSGSQSGTQTGTTAPALNSPGSLQLAAGQPASWGPNTGGVPTGALSCVAAGAGPLYVEWN